MNFSDYLVFVDESGDHSLTSINQEYPVFVLCFCVIEKQQYISETVPAIQKLKMEIFGHDQVILHEHDIRKRKGPFKNLNKPAREEFFERLNAIMEASEMTIISAVIDKVRHKAKYATPHHPYHLALLFGLERVAEILDSHRQHNRLTHVIFEERGKKEDRELELEFRRVCKQFDEVDPPCPLEIVFANKLSNSSGIQLADITARPVGLSVIKPAQANRAYKIIEKKFYSGKYGVVRGNGLKVFP